MEFRYWGLKVIVQKKDISFFKELENSIFEKLKMDMKNKIRFIDKIKIFFLSLIVMVASFSLILALIINFFPHPNFFTSVMLIIAPIFLFFFSFKKLKKRYNPLKVAKKISYKKAKKEFIEKKVMTIVLYTTSEGLEIFQNLGSVKEVSNSDLTIETQMKLTAYNAGANAVINVQYQNSVLSTIKSAFNGIGARRHISTKHKTTYYLTGDLVIIKK